LRQRFATFFPNLFQLLFRTCTAPFQSISRSRAVITTLVLLGKFWNCAPDNGQRAIRALANLAPQQAHLLAADGTEKDVALDQVKSGDRLRVRPASVLPVDGVIREGASALDESMVTGEPMPSKKQQVTSHRRHLNTSGSFIMEVERVGGETMLRKS